MSARLQKKLTQSSPGSRGFSVLHFILLPVLIILAILGLLEIFTRTQAARLVFPLRSYGNYHTQFEIKWQKLNQYVKENGGVDVILLGSSMVNTGIDPSILSAQLKTSTGEELRIYNFGVEGLTVVPMVDLARLLADTYHPRTIIYFTELRDYMAGNGDEVAQSFLNNQWLQYRLGQTSVIGWAVDHSAALQVLLPVRTWSRADFLDTYLQNLRRLENTRADGYEPEIQITDFKGEIPNPSDPASKKLFELYSEYTIDPARLQSLEAMIELGKSGTNIWISEFPAYPAFYHYFGGEHVHEVYLAAIQEFIADRGGVFLSPINPALIPLNGRSDDHHLNLNGAQTYSILLAQQFSGLCQEQGRCLERK